MCERVINNQSFFLVSFFLSNPIVSECVSECKKPTSGIRALRSTCGDAAKGR